MSPERPEMHSQFYVDPSTTRPVELTNASLPGARTELAVAVPDQQLYLALRIGDPLTRSRAALVLAVRKPPEGVDALMEGLTADPGNEFNRHLLFALSRYGDAAARALPVIVLEFNSQADPYMKIECIKVMDAVGGRQAVKTITSLCTHPDDDVARFAVQLIGSRAGYADLTVPDLIKACSHPYTTDERFEDLRGALNRLGWSVENQRWHEWYTVRERIFVHASRIREGTYVRVREGNAPVSMHEGVLHSVYKDGMECFVSLRKPETDHLISIPLNDHSSLSACGGNSR